ncbi:MAG: hypothetical protein PSN34_06230 [Urechidicola sp.]|nr:hypothetical protein [Urechidicola sp.]
MKKIILILVIGFFTSLSFGQAAKVKAVDFITLTTVQRDALPATTDARLIYNISNVQFEYWNGVSWAPISSGGVDLSGYLLNTTDTFTGNLNISNGTLGVSANHKIHLDFFNDEFSFFLFDDNNSYGFNGGGGNIYGSSVNHYFVEGETGLLNDVYANSFIADSFKTPTGTNLNVLLDGGGNKSLSDFALATNYLPLSGGTMTGVLDMGLNGSLTSQINFGGGAGTITYDDNILTRGFRINEPLNILGTRLHLSDVGGDKQFIDASTGNIVIGSDAYAVDIKADAGLLVDNGIFSSTSISTSGQIRIEGTVGYSQLTSLNNGADTTISFPNESGTVVLESNLSGYALSVDLDNKQDLPFTTKTGTEIDLSNTAGNLHNNGARSTAIAYTIKIGSVEGGNAKAPISTTGLVDFPTIAGANPLTGSAFVANAEYDMYVYYDNDTDGVQYYFDRTDGTGATSTTQTYIAEHQNRVYCLTTNDWTGLGTYGLTNNNLATSKGTAAAPVYNDADIGLTQLPTGAILDRLEIMLISVSAEITDMDFTMSAIGTDYTAETNGLVETVIVSPVSLNSPTTVGSNGLFTTIDLADYTMTGNRTLTYAFKPVGTLTATRYMVYRLKLYYTLP